MTKSVGCSEPGKTPEKAGAYLMVNTYMVTKVTSFMFLTGMGGNVLAAEFMSQMSGVTLDWMTWAKALVVPGLVLLLITPYICYLLEKPTVTTVDNKAIAQAGLRELGPMSMKEKVLVGVFVLALLGWCLPSVIEQVAGIKVKVDATAVAVGAMVALLLSDVLTWDDMAKNKGGWKTLIWFGGIIGLSSALTKLKFFDWVGKMMQANLSFGDNAAVALWVLIVVSVVVRYIFASATAYIVALIPVLLMLGKVAGINPMILCLQLAAANSFGGALTHYGGPAAPIIFGAGYNETKKWWIVGGVFAVVCVVVMMVLGPVWWKMIGLV